MLQQCNRFHGHGSLKFVYKNGQAVRSSLATVKYINNPYRHHSRFAVVVSQTVVKSAVRRNRIRRRIYEIIRLELAFLKDDQDVVAIIFSPEVLLMPHKELKQAIKGLFSQAQLYK